MICRAFPAQYVKICDITLLYVFLLSITAQDVVCLGPKKGDILSILCKFELCKSQI